MSTYAIGDIQGCYDELQRLLEHIDFDRARDTLWFVGDLVNRGPLSTQVLRFVRSLGDAAVTVLGNHDLHLLALAAGAAGTRPAGTLAPVLAAPDRDELLDWLRRRPLMHHDPALDFVMVHAGIAPAWDTAEAAACAREVEAVLQGNDPDAFFHHMYGDEPVRWHEGMAGAERRRYIVNAFTRMRYVRTADASLAHKPVTAPGEQEPGLVPWFQAPGRRSRGQRIVFGHWSTLQRIVWPEEQVWGIDTGAVWGRTLTALRLDDVALFSVSSPEYRQHR